MPGEICKESRKPLDQYSSYGFPTTESGVEFKVLEKCFTDEALHLTSKAEDRRCYPPATGREAMIMMADKREKSLN